MPTPKFSRRELLRMAVVGLATVPFIARASDAPPRPLTLLDLIDDLLLREQLYGSPAFKTLPIGADGAVGVNSRWEAGHAPQWFIESQRIAGDLVQAGLGRPDPALVQLAPSIMRWGFARQADDGSFPGSTDFFHSTEILVADIGRALLLLRQAGSEEHRTFVNELVPSLERAALWMTQPAVLSAGLKHNLPYTHRHYILAAALGLTAELTSNPALAAAAATSAGQGLIRQTAEGINPEKGGFDVNYQSAGLLFASRYFPSCTDAAVKDRLREMIRRGGRWLATRINADGELDAAGSTRVNGQEHLRSGKIKGVNYMEMVQTFAHAARITGEAEFATVARRLAAHNSPIGPDQLV